MNKVFILITLCIAFFFITPCSDSNNQDSATSNPAELNMESNEEVANDSSNPTEQIDEGAITNFPSRPDEYAVRKWTANRGVIRVVLPKEEIIVNINSIDNKNYPVITLYVSVTDKDGAPLEVEDINEFYIEENGEPLPSSRIVSVVQQKNTDLTTPVNMILAIDKSGSMADDGERRNVPVEEQPLTFAKDAAISFIRGIGEADTVQCIAFDGDLHPLGTNADAIESIQGLQPLGATALYGALYNSVMEVQDKPGIRSVILMTDGKNDIGVSTMDWLKDITLQEGITLADEASVPVFTIAFGEGADRQILQRIAEDTHATYFETGNKEELTELYENIRQIINNQYVITYQTTNLNMSDVYVEFGLGHDSRVISHEGVAGRERMLQMVEQQEQLDQLKSELEREQERLDTERQELVEWETRLQEREEELQQRQVDMSARREELQSWENRLNATEVELLEMDQDNLRRDQELAALNRQLNERANQLDQQAAQLQQQAELLDSKENDINREAQRLATLETNLNTREQEMTQRNTELTRLQNQLTAKQTELNQLETRLGRIQAGLTQKESELNQLQAELNQRQLSLEQLQTSLNTQKQELDALSASLNQRESTITAQRQAIAEREQRLQQQQTALNQRRAELEAQARELSTKSTELEAQAARLQGQASELNALEQQLTQQQTRLQQMRAMITEAVQTIGTTADQLEQEVQE